MRMLLLLLLLPPFVRATPVASPLRPDDKIRLKILTLEAAADAGPDRHVLSARLLLCVETAQDPALCQAVGTTRGFEIEAGHSRNFTDERVKVFPAVYSDIVTGQDIAERLATLPENTIVKATFMKVELRLNADHDGQTVAFRRADFPPAELEPEDANGILRINLPMGAAPGRAKFGAKLAILIRRSR